MAIDWAGLARGANNQWYNFTGYDPMGLNKPDWYGSKIQRDTATKLGGVANQQYKAAQNVIAEKYKQAKVDALRQAQARGLQSSGMAQSTSNQLAAQQANEEANVYAGLLREEQTFLDNLYMQNKEIAVKVAQQERAEALARQQMFQDWMLSYVDIVGAGLGTVNQVAPVAAAAAL